jgi:outer membrane protein OmpA-like peptidoglycan-associated protein
VIDANRAWRRWHFRGLKDPMAREPRAVLASAGFTAPSIDGEWKPILTHDSAIVVARARRALSARIDEMRRSVEDTRIFFEPGSARVTDAEGLNVRALAQSMRRLADSASAAGGAVRIDLVGRTDPTGTDATNQSLANLRVDAVLRRLELAGVPAAMLNGRPVATAQPLRADDVAEQARINRSVSFEAVVTSGSHAPRGP